MPKEILNEKGTALVYILIGVVVLVGIVVGVNYLGIQQNNSTSNKLTIKPSPVTTTQPVSADKNAIWRTYTSVQIPGNSLKPYSLQYPESWSLKVLREQKSDTLTLAKGEYEIGIYQASYGGGGCIFEGEVPEGPYDDLRNIAYAQIESGIGILRRVAKPSMSDKNTTVFGFCWSSDGKVFGSPTLYGAISYRVPTNYDQSIVEEMDSILKTLKKAK